MRARVGDLKGRISRDGMGTVFLFDVGQHQNIIGPNLFPIAQYLGRLTIYQPLICHMAKDEPFGPNKI